MTLANADPGSRHPLRIAGTPIPVLGTARVYVCGITPYDTTHMGHAATFVWADMAARVLRLTGCEVEVCRNITDVDDHLLEQARDKGVPWKSLATQQTYRFERDMQELGIGQPAYEPRSHDHVDGVIALAQELVSRGAAYERKGTVYFRGKGVAESAGVARDEAIALAQERGGRPEDPDKDDPLDASLWVRSERGEPAWPSPWGEGRPGWHAECTAMALTTLGPALDLHAGGADLAFPHHAYEAAQAEAYTGVRPFSRSWMHVGAVMTGGTKMAKSTGNLVFVHELLDRFSPAALRLLVLSRRYDQAWELGDQAIADAERELEELRSLMGVPGGSEAELSEVRRALLDDLDLPRALAVAKDAGGGVLSDLMNLLGLTRIDEWY
jgi:cysteinyl-tRNA synthetase